MIIIFTGPPFSGKDTQAKLLADKLRIPVFSMGALIRDAYQKKDPRGVEGFEQYSMKGLHVPIKLKFDLMREKIDANSDGVIIDNFPGNAEDITAFSDYMLEKNLKVDFVFHILISKEEMMRRMTERGRQDDKPEIVLKRREIQDEEREFVLKYFREQGLLKEIDGERSIDTIHDEILDYVKQ